MSPLSQPYSWAATVLVDELDASSLEHRFNSCQRSFVTDVPSGLNVGDRVPDGASWLQPNRAPSNLGLLAAIRTCAPVTGMVLCLLSHVPQAQQSGDERLPCRTPSRKVVTTARTRRYFIGGSMPAIIMGDDEAALLRLWREKRGEAEPEDLSGNLIVQLGARHRGAQSPVVRSQQRARTSSTSKSMSVILVFAGWRYPRWPCVESSGAVFEAKFMLPWSFSEEAAAEKYMPQLQHNMWVLAAGLSVLSIITGGGKWVEIKFPADPLYQHLMSQPSASSGAVSRAASPLACSASIRRSRGSRRSELST